MAPRGATAGRARPLQGAAGCGPKDQGSQATDPSCSGSSASNKLNGASRSPELTNLEYVEKLLMLPCGHKKEERVNLAQLRLGALVVSARDLKTGR